MEQDRYDDDILRIPLPTPSDLKNFNMMPGRDSIVSPEPTQSQRGRKRKLDVIESIETDNQRDTICHCESPQAQTKPGFYLCISCLDLQHLACMLCDDDYNHDNDRHSPYCNNCRTADLRHQIKTQRAQIDRLQPAVERKRAAMETFYGEVLWKHYCTLPDGVSNAIVRGITEIEWVDGKILPVYEAPQSWIERMQTCVVRMMDDLGDEATEPYIDLDTPTILDVHVLAQWREMARWTLHHGPHRGHTARIGLLAELLGFVEKGTFWDGQIP